MTATSGREALDAASVYYPDIVLLDLIMPPPDGFAVCAALRTSLPPQVILMTGLSDDEHVRRALDLGVVALLRKPLSRENVVDAVNLLPNDRPAIRWPSCAGTSACIQSLKKC